MNIRTFVCLAAILAGSILWAQSDRQNQRFAVIVDVNGKGYYSTPGVPKGDLRKGLTLPEGTKIWTTKGDALIYFRRIATIVKLEPQSELILEKLDQHPKDGFMVKETVLSLNKGRILTRPRVLLPDSKFTVQTPVSIFSVPDVGYARYDLRADGTAIVGKKSKLPLRAEAPNRFTNQVMAGSMLTPAGKTNALHGDRLIPELDELEELADSLASPLTAQDYIPGKLPPK